MGASPHPPSMRKSCTCRLGYRAPMVREGAEAKAALGHEGKAPYLFYTQKLCLSVKLSAKGKNERSAASMLYCLLILSFPGIGHYCPWVRGADCSARSTKYEYDSIPAPKCNSVFAKYFFKTSERRLFWHRYCSSASQKCPGECSCQRPAGSFWSGSSGGRGMAGSGAG